MKVEQGFDRQWQKYMRRFPENPLSVRFTRKELDKYFATSVKIVSCYVENQQLSGWIYRENVVSEKNNV